jgi:hypothetical protein
VTQDIGAVRFISPDSTWVNLGHVVSPRRRFGALAMVKWRAWGIGLEWFEFNWLGLFIGPFCVAFGRIEPALAIEAQRGETAQPVRSEGRKRGPKASPNPGRDQ